MKNIKVATAELCVVHALRLPHWRAALKAREYSARALSGSTNLGETVPPHPLTKSRRVTPLRTRAGRRHERGQQSIKDHQGSVRLVINVQTGEVAQSIDYDAWGRVLNETGAGFQPFGFAGGLYDADTKLVRFGARDYDPGMGRWTNRDPIGFAGGQGNLYLYVDGEPVNRVDPDGLRDRPAAEIARLLRQYVNDLIRANHRYAAMKRLHEGCGDLDFFCAAPDDTFEVANLGKLKPAQFGEQERPRTCHP